MAVISGNPGAAPAQQAGDPAPSGGSGGVVDRQDVAAHLPQGQSPDALTGGLSLIDVTRGKMPADAGAHYGMAASVTATAFSGAATASFPVRASPARGFEPSLLVQYSSQAGDGVFGLGFALDLPCVERRTNRRIPRYDGRDEFQLGDEALARLPARDTRRQAAGVTYEVRCYARRADQSAERIEHWSPTGGGPGFWRTISAAGLVTVFGVTAQARIADPASGRRVFAWLPEASYDASGSAVGYRYKQEDDAGVPDAIYERNRQRSANRYPSLIGYGNQAPFLPESPADLPAGPWHLECVFDYGEYDFSPANDSPYRPVRPWPARELPFSDYSAGFERRTHRLCRSIAMFHRFGALGPEPVLVHTISFDFALTTGADLVTHLVSVRNRGHRHISSRPLGQRYWIADEPAVTLGYHPPELASAEFEPLRTQVAGVPPVADNASSYCLADLDGTGVAGIVYADSRSLWYWRPSLDPADLDGPVRFDPDQPALMPVERRVAGEYSLGDVTGDGRLALIVDQPGLAGFYGRTPPGAWRPFRSFGQRVLDSPAGGYSRVDLTGNGFPDLVRFTDVAVTYAPNLGEEGYAAFERVTRRADLPAGLTSAPRAGVRFADVLGGGEQLVLVQSGRLICWPSLGYGVFGAPVQPGGVPRFDDVPDERVLLADLTGTGQADLVLLRPGLVEIYLNQAGNRFASAPLRLTTPVAAAGTITSAQVSTDGRQSLVFSTGGQQPRHYALTLSRDLQPFLLSELDTGLGMVTRLGYSTSARMRLQDEAKGEPWQIDLPFPVTVLASIDEDDEIAGVRASTSYRYRDGYFDPVERVFAGFARVDQADSQTLLLADALPGGDDAVAAEPAGVAPTLTRTWFQVGCYGIDGFDQALRREFFSGDHRAYPMPGPTFEWGGVTPDSTLARQAHLALSGSALRTETYDGGQPDVPYEVKQSELTVRLVAPPAGAAAAFLLHERESITYAYEREADDPAVRHEFTLEVDKYGDVRRECAVYYRRRPPASALAGQDVTVVEVTTRDLLPARDEPDLFLHGFAGRSATYGVRGIDPPGVLGLYYSAPAITAQVARALHGEAPASALLLTAERISYDGDGGAAPPAPLAAPPRIRRRDVAAFTDKQIRDLLAGVPLPVPVDRLLAEQGAYSFEPATGMWWQTGDTTSYDAALFWQASAVADPVASLDPARGATRTLHYDETAMTVVEVVHSANAGGLLPQRENVERFDYQALMPQRAKDVNGVVGDALFDPLGRAFAASFRGRSYTGGVVREIGFPALPADDPAAWPQPANVLELAADPAAFLRDAAEFVFYDNRGWRSGSPVLVATVAAPGYPQDPAPCLAGPVRLTVKYADASGRPLQTTTRAGAPDAQAQDGIQWAVSGRIRYNGLGEPLQAYLPFFTGTPASPGYQDVARTEVGPLFSYDPLGRLVRTDYPRGDFPRGAFYSTTSHRPWSQADADADDTVTSSRYYRYFIDQGHPLPEPEREALIAAAAFEGTQTTSHRGVLGEVVALDRLLARDQPLRSLSSYDDAGRQVTAADPRQAAAGRVNLTLGYAMRQDPINVISTDAGPSIVLNDASGAPLLSVDGRGTLTLYQVDALHRPVAVSVTEPAGADGNPGPGADHTLVVERHYYGDTLDSAGATIFADPADRGLTGRPCVSYDQAGRHAVTAYSLTGNPIEISETFARDLASDPDWQPGSASTWPAIFAALATRLEEPAYRASGWFGPLGDQLLRVDQAGDTTRPRFEAAGNVVGIDVALPGAELTPYLANATYNAAGQRLSTDYGDEANKQVIAREFSYERATGRLARVRSSRPADGELLQDLSYVYDPVGNLMFASDQAAPAAQAANADLRYRYDALYRLTAATGRAVTSFGPADAATGGYEPVYRRPPDFGLGRYTAEFGYDSADNCLSQTFTIGAASWVTTLTPAPDSNRASAGDSFDPAGFDGSGNAVRLPGLPLLGWDYRDALRMARYQAGTTVGTEYYAYDCGGTRRRAVTLAPGGAAVTDVLCFPGLDIVREEGADGEVTAQYQRIRLFVGGLQDGEILNWTAGQPPPGAAPRQRRYRLDNIVGSAMMELAADGSVTGYEEYSPFGATVFATGPNLADVALNAYRYTGQERRQTTGLSYHGARHYAPWLARWLSPDPAGTADGLNLYAYAGNSPVIHLDPTGRYKRYLRPLRKTFGRSDLDYVSRSRILRREIRKRLREGWRFELSDNGSYMERESRLIRIDRRRRGWDFVRSVSHEVGHSSYHPPPEWHWWRGVSKAGYIRRNVRRVLDDEAEATLFQAKVRRELGRSGYREMELSGANRGLYAGIYLQYVRGRFTRKDAVRRIGDLYRNEVGSGTGGITYEEENTTHYRRRWERRFGKHRDVS